MVAWNKSHQPSFLPRHQQLSTLTQILYNNCFQIILDLEIAKHPLTAFSHQAKIKVPIIKPSLEMSLLNKIKVSKNPLKIQKITDLVNKFSII